MRLSDIIILSAALALCAAAGIVPAMNSGEYCDPDFCAKTRAEIQAYHEASQWTQYDPEKVRWVEARGGKQ